jgi:hypothetical protein
MLAGGYLHAAETNKTNGRQRVSAGRGEKKRKKGEGNEALWQVTEAW